MLHFYLLGISATANYLANCSNKSNIKYTNFKSDTYSHTIIISVLEIQNVREKSNKIAFLKPC